MKPSQKEPQRYPMDFRHVFFDPKGRIGPRTFGQGYVLLTGLMLVVTVLARLLIVVARELLME